MIGAAVRGALTRAALVSGGFTAAALTVSRSPLPDLLRAAAMLALPCSLIAVLRREERRIAAAAERARARPPVPAAPGRPPR